MNVKAETIWCCIHIDVIFEHSKIKGKSNTRTRSINILRYRFRSKCSRKLFIIETEGQQYALIIIFNHSFRYFNNTVEKGPGINFQLYLYLFVPERHDQLFETFLFFLSYLESIN